MMTPGKAKNIYWGPAPLPHGAKSLGEFVDGCRRGCLIELASGITVVGKFGVIQSIPQRGGKQPGAGRPKLPAYLKKETKGIRLPLWMWDWLDGQDDARGVIVEDAIKKVHKLKTPQRGEQSKCKSKNH